MIRTIGYLAVAVVAVVLIARNAPSPTTAAPLGLVLIALVVVLVTSQRPTQELVAVIRALSDLIWGPRNR